MHKLPKLNTKYVPTSHIFHEMKVMWRGYNDNMLLSIWIIVQGNVQV
jgi:hypothetical protein